VKKLSIFTCSIFFLVMLSACGQSVTTNQVSSQTAQKADSSAAGLLTSVKTTQAFSEEQIPSEDVESILKAGINSPSAMNTQPWHFSVVTDKAVLEKISGDMSGGMPGGAPPKGAVPPKDASKPQGTPPQGEANKAPSNPPPGAGMPKSGAKKAGIADAPLVIIISCKEGSQFDAGLACQNMAAEAQLLEYGTKILTSPTIALNSSKQAEYKKLLGTPDDHTFVAALLVGKASSSDEKVDSVSSASVRNSFSDMVTYVKP
jgi:nitroreductase